MISAAQGAQYYVRPGVTYVPFDDAPPIEYGLVWRRAGNTARVAEFARAAREVALAPPRLNAVREPEGCGGASSRESSAG